MVGAGRDGYGLAGGDVGDSAVEGGAEGAGEDVEGFGLVFVVVVGWDVDRVAGGDGGAGGVEGAVGFIIGMEAGGEEFEGCAAGFGGYGFQVGLLCAWGGGGEEGEHGGG